MTAEAAAIAGSEAALVEAWFAAQGRDLRLEDGRRLRVIFPGIPGAGHGPDVRDAILDAGGDYLQGDVELHLATSGWRAHGHHRDPAYGRVVLHVVAVNDAHEAVTLHRAGRKIPILVLRLPASPSFPPPFTPPCAFEAANGRNFAPALTALSLRRLRIKAAALAPQVDARGPAPALYRALLETIGGPANQTAFSAIADALPLAALLECVSNAPGVPRSLAFTAELRPLLATAALNHAGLRPAARPARRIEAAGALLAQLWPAEPAPTWPELLSPDARLPRTLQVPGIGRALAIELSLNAVLPVALASGLWPEDVVEAAWQRLPSPGTYGRLRQLEGWLGSGREPPFRTAANLQAGLLLHADYCSQGRCGRCPVSSG